MLKTIGRLLQRLYTINPIKKMKESADGCYISAYWRWFLSEVLYWTEIICILYEY